MATKKFILSSAFVAAMFGFFSSCSGDSSYTLSDMMYVVSAYNIGTGAVYFIDDAGTIIMPRKQQGLDDISSGKRCLIAYSYDQNSWSEDQKIFSVDMLDLVEVPSVQVLPWTTDTIGLDPFYKPDSNSNWAVAANGFLTTHFFFQYSGTEAGAKKHTFGLAEDPLYGVDYRRNDTIHLLLWRNAHGDALSGVAAWHHNCTSLSNWYIQDSAVFAIRYKVGSSQESSEWDMLYTKYKRQSN